MASADRTQEARAPLWWALVAGLAFAVVATAGVPLAGFDIGGWDADYFSGQVTWASLFAGSFIGGAVLWWLLVMRPQRVSLLRGAVTGVGVAILAYPLVFAIAGLARRASPLDAPGERTLQVLELSALGLLTTGFGTTLLMAVTGAVLAFALRPVFPVAPVPVGGIGRKVAKAAGFIAGSIVGLLLLCFLVLSFLPLNGASLGAAAAAGAAATHDEALAAFETVKAREAQLDLHPRCNSVLLTHGSKAARVVVLLHGFTSCPAQYDELAPKLFALGYNVYVPLLPRHGEADRLTLALAGLTAEELVATTTEALGIAGGLGEHVSIAGLSGGGTMAAWAGQNRADAGAILAMAPFLGPKGMPAWANRAAMNLMLVLPNIMVAWDPLEPEATPGIDYAYPRWATHGLAQFIRLGEVVAEEARHTAPVAPALGMLLNEADDAVSNDLARRLISQWRTHGRQVEETNLPRALGLDHDIIDPRQPAANTALVYPIIIDLLQRQAGAE
ncbi:MAG TPA: alpha/beta hydrolase [Devosia sp.]|nr:alpha/beta hydrolase [Devosia sp.]